MSSTSSGLSAALERITEIDARVKELEASVKDLKAQRAHYEGVAIEEMASGRLDGVKVAGRSWRVEIEHSVSIPSGVKAEIVEAARRAGLDDMVTIPTTSLKSYLRELAKDRGSDPESPWSDGTEFAGLVGEYIRPVLRYASS